MQKTLIAVCAMFAASNANPSQNEVKTSTAPHKSIKKDYTKEKIEKFVFIIRPNKKFAKKISTCIIQSAKHNKISPYIVATTGYVESELSMKSGPCVGIMQVEMNTYNSTDKSSGLNPRKLQDNIELGARELSRYYYSARANKLASRGGYTARLRYMWGRYNGCGVSPNNDYIGKVERVHRRIQKESIKQLIARLVKQHTLWKK